MVLDTFEPVGNLISLCGCANTELDFEPSTDDIRTISDARMDSGNVPSSLGLKNLVWAWGQFLDHDIVRPSLCLLVVQQVGACFKAISAVAAGGAGRSPTTAHSRAVAEAARPRAEELCVVLVHWH